MTKIFANTYAMAIISVILIVLIVLVTLSVNANYNSVDSVGQAYAELGILKVESNPAMTRIYTATDPSVTYAYMRNDRNIVDDQ